MTWKQRLMELTMAGGIAGGALVLPSCMNCYQRYQRNLCSEEIECRNVELCAEQNGASDSDGGCVLQDGGVITFDPDGGVHRP